MVQRVPKAAPRQPQTRPAGLARQPGSPAWLASQPGWLAWLGWLAGLAGWLAAILNEGKDWPGEATQAGDGAAPLLLSPQVGYLVYEKGGWEPYL